MGIHKCFPKKLSFAIHRWQHDLTLKYVTSKHQLQQAITSWVFRFEMKKIYQKYENRYKHKYAALECYVSLLFK